MTSALAKNIIRNKTASIYVYTHDEHDSKLSSRLQKKKLHVQFVYISENAWALMYNKYPSIICIHSGISDASRN